MRRFFFLGILTFLLFFGVIQQALAGEASVDLSMVQALRMAQERHVDMLVANERVQQALARITQAKSALFPRFDGSISMERDRVNLKSFGINPNVPGVTFDLTPPAFNVFDARLYLKQTLFDFTVLKRLKAAHSGERLSQAEREKAEEDALALVANLYLEAERAQEATGYLLALQRREESRLALANSQLQLGLGSEFQVTQARSSVASVRYQVASAKAEALERRLDLAAALGLPEDQAIRFTSGMDRVTGQTPSEAEIREQISSHPDVEVARKQVDLKVQERKQEVAEYYPKLNASADYGGNGPHPGDLDQTYTYGGQLAIPIFQGKLRQSRVQEATSKIKESELQLAQLEKDQLAKALSARESLRQAAEGLNSAQAELTEARQQLGLSRDRLQIGTGERIQVVDADAALASALDKVSEARATYALAWIQLRHRLGQMKRWALEGSLPR